MNVIQEILNNRLVTIFPFTFFIIVVTFLLNKMFAKAEKTILTKIQPQKPASEVYFDTEMAISIANYMLAACIVADVNGNIVYINEMTTKILHWRKEEMMGQNLDMIIPEASRPMHNAAMEEYRRTGHGKVFGKPMQLQCLTKGNVKLPVEITIDEMLVHGKVYVIGKIRDMTRQLEQIEEIRREANKENEWLRKEVEYYREIERETCGGMMKWLYPKDRVLMSRGMQTLFDLHQPECLTAATTGRLIQEDREKIANTILNAVKEGKPGYELSCRLLNGRHVLISASIKRNRDGLPLVIYGIMHQIKE